MTVDVYIQAGLCSVYRPTKGDSFCLSGLPPGCIHLCSFSHTELPLVRVLGLFSEAVSSWILLCNSHKFLCTDSDFFSFPTFLFFCSWEHCFVSSFTGSSAVSRSQHRPPLLSCSLSLFSSLWRRTAVDLPMYWLPCSYSSDICPKQLRLSCYLTLIAPWQLSHTQDKPHLSRISSVFTPETLLPAQSRGFPPLSVHLPKVILHFWVPISLSR